MDSDKGADDVNEDSEVDEITHPGTHQSLGVFPGDNESKADTLAHDEDIDEDSESLDPRIQEELEKLNCSTDVINKLEVDLEVGNLAGSHLGQNDNWAKDIWA